MDLADRGLGHLLEEVPPGENRATEAAQPGGVLGQSPQVVQVHPDEKDRRPRRAPSRRARSRRRPRPRWPATERLDQLAVHRVALLRPVEYEVADLSAVLCCGPMTWGPGYPGVAPRRGRAFRPGRRKARGPGRRPVPMRVPRPRNQSRTRPISPSAGKPRAPRELVAAIIGAEAGRRRRPGGGGWHTCWRRSALGVAWARRSARARCTRATRWCGAGCAAQLRSAR